MVIDQEIYAKICSCMMTVRTVKTQFSPELKFKENLGYESIDVVDLLYELEQEFGAQFSMNELNRYVLIELNHNTWDFSIGEICTFVEKKLKIK